MGARWIFFRGGQIRGSWSTSVVQGRGPGWNLGAKPPKADMF